MASIWLRVNRRRRRKESLDRQYRVGIEKVTEIHHAHVWYGLAITKDGGGFLGHAGTLPGFNTSAGSQPGARATIVVPTNSDAPAQAELQEDHGRGPAQRLFARLAKIVFGLQRAP